MEKKQRRSGRWDILVIVLTVAGIFSFVSMWPDGGEIPGSKSYKSLLDYDNGLTEAEIAHIDSMRVILQEAPERSIISRFDVNNGDETRLEGIWMWVDSAKVFDAVVPGPRIVSGREVSETYIQSIKKITYPGDSEYDSLGNKFFKANN